MDKFTVTTGNKDTVELNRLTRTIKLHDMWNRQYHNTVSSMFKKYKSLDDWSQDELMKVALCGVKYINYAIDIDAINHRLDSTYQTPFEVKQNSFNLITAKYDVFHYYCIKAIKDIFTDKKGIFNVNLAVNYIIDMEYKSDFYTTSKDVLWKCFGNVIVDNLNQNQKTGITLKERPRMCYKKAVKGNDELDQMITNRMERKSVDITQADMNYMGAVLQTKKNGSYYQNDVGLLFALLCHYKYAKQSGRLKEDGSFYIIRKKHKTIIKPNGKKKRVDISYNMNKIMEMVGAKSYAGSFTRFIDSGIQIEMDENKISINLDIEEEDNSEILFTVQDIYNPMIYLQAYNEDKELSECVVCGKHFIKDRNKKTCSGECHDKLHNLQVGKNNRKISLLP